MLVGFAAALSISRIKADVCQYYEQPPVISNFQASIAERKTSISKRSTESWWRAAKLSTIGFLYRHLNDAPFLPLARCS